MNDLISVLLQYGVPAFVVALIYVGFFEVRAFDRAVGKVTAPAQTCIPEYVPFDPDYAAIGAIEPVFQDRLVGYYNEELLVNNDDIVTMFSASSDVPIYLPRRRRSIKPLPRIEKELRWKTVAD